VRVFETISDKKLIDDSMWLLEKSLGKSLPSPATIWRSKWMTDRNFYGTYSYLSMTTAANNITYVDLAEPLYDAGSKPTILFAGEATDEMFGSNGHGAVRSGFRDGLRIADFYKT